VTRSLVVFAFLACCLNPVAWGGSVYTFTQVSPAGQQENMNSGAAINTSGLVAWVNGSSINTWNGVSLSTYNPGVNILSVGTNIGLSDANAVSFSYQSGANYLAGDYSIPGGTLASFQYPGQQYTYAGGSSPNGLVAGNYAGNTGFVWTGGNAYTDITYPGPHGQVYVFGVNDAGHVVGANWCCNLGLSFLDAGGVFTTISVPGYADGNVWAMNVNNSDTVVGDVWDGSHTHGFVWQNGVGSIVDYTGATDTIIYGINSSGELVGEADFGNPYNAIVFTATSTPEPGTLALMLGAGLLAVCCRQFRRKNDVRA
jgi:hypothetical protein